MIHLVATLIVCIAVVLVAVVVAAGVFSIMHGRLRRGKVNPAVQAARDNLEVSRLHAQRDVIEFQRDRLVDARAEGKELPPGAADLGKPESKHGEVIDPHRW